MALRYMLYIYIVLGKNIEYLIKYFKITAMNLLLNRIIILSIIMTIACGNDSVKRNDFLSGKPGRPLIVDNTLVASDSIRLRGGTFWLYGWIPDKTTWAMSDAPWKAMKDNHLNVVRLSCAYRPDNQGNYSLDQYEDFLDKLISCAEASGVYAIIDYHPKPGTYNMTEARTFWTRMASRYKDRENVIFELINEPVFSQPENYTDQNLRDIEELWNLCNDLAPKTPIIIMSFCQVGDSGRTPVQVTDSLRGIDWTKTIVGFHSYWRDTSARITDLKNHYPCINTEFGNVRSGSNIMKVMDGYRHHGTLMEKLGISWMHWTILDRESSLNNLNTVITDLKEKGYYWITK